jgi:hypothetical protein
VPFPIQEKAERNQQKQKEKPALRAQEGELIDGQNVAAN